MFIAHPSNQVRDLTLPLLMVLALAPMFASAENGFEQGKMRISASAGTGSVNNVNYFQLGVGAGYYLWDGVEVGLDVRSWLGGRYKIHEVSPSVTYVFTHFESFKPYGGVLYRRTFIGGRDDVSAHGARGGLFLQYSENLRLRAGIAAIRHHDCDRTVNAECTEFYPEFSAGLYF